VSAGAPIRVVVADDHPLVRKGVAAVLAPQSDIEVVGEIPPGVTRGTAKWFVSSILGKLGADDRTEAVTTALERGILHP
jgi:DNA-binding NarL/FixJ family response regulator